MSQNLTIEEAARLETPEFWARTTLPAEECFRLRVTRPPNDQPPPAPDSAAARLAASLQQWQAQVPDEYQQTDIDHPKIHPLVRSSVLGWDPSGRRGLGFIGKTELGKTRGLTFALGRAVREGRSWLWARACEITGAGTTAFLPGSSDAERAAAFRLLRRASSVEVLVLDDLGKGGASDRATDALFQVVEERTAEGLPILWSAQAGGAWLEHRLGIDRGPAIIRRLAEFCHCPQLPRA